MLQTKRLCDKAFKDGMFHRLSYCRKCCPIETVWEILLIKIDFGRPNAQMTNS